MLRDKIKQDLLTLRLHENPSVVKDAGICLGSIATVELPVGLWDEFRTMMANDAANEDSKYRLAAVQTLGYTMEFIDIYKKQSLDSNQIFQVLDSLPSIILNIDSENLELTKIAVHSLGRAVPFQKEFARDDHRALINEGISKALAIEDPEVREIAWSVMPRPSDLAPSREIFCFFFYCFSSFLFF